MTELNRLWGNRFYLCGPIDRANDRGQGWRENIIPFIHSLNALVLNPLDKPIDKDWETLECSQHRQKIKQQQKFNELSKLMKTIRVIDLRLVDIADALIVYLNLDIYSVGTFEEIFLANRQKKPILIVLEQGKINMPDWLWGTLPHEHFFDDFYQLEKYLMHVDRGQNVDSLNRWTWIDYKKLNNSNDKALEKNEEEWTNVLYHLIDTIDGPRGKSLSEDVERAQIYIKKLKKLASSRSCISSI